MNLKELGIMTFPEASERWNKERSYVVQQLADNPHKFLEGSIDRIGKGKGTQIITKAGMEHLTGITEKEANEGLWLVRHEINWIVDFEKRVNSEIEARKLITSLASEELNENNKTFNFEELDTKKKKSILKLRGNSIYTYEKSVK
ncbi:hypothetical protein CI088_01515 [Enterococcus plantarum]|uniref:Helix-turn-helix domain-containing protein n=1 Tax=Enterococcus plantarum TaxID=1077675 RepID=A0A2W3ZD44_9ENTE|nr:helix-turn-helix domain-containing protein [Enterococcus plantarum]PZL77506.1 hypothetical protein CI088_01515 [Enterococcus plantarum]